MNLTQAVSSGFAHFFNWKGRASRPAFWWLWLASVLALLVASVIDYALGSRDAGDFWVFQNLTALAFLFPLLSATVRRLHDTGRSGWWWWIQLIPLVGSIVILVFLVLRGDEGDNRFGPDPGSGVSAPSEVAPAAA